MRTKPYRRLGALTLAAVSIATTAATLPVRAETADGAAHLMELGSADAALLTQDLGALLAAAQYLRSSSDPRAPRNSITSVRQIGDALRAHHGVAYVFLARRIAGDDRVALKALYVLEGEPIAGGSAVPSAAAARPGKGAVRLDLSNDEGQALLASVQGHLGGLASAGAEVSVEEVLNALASPNQVAYLLVGAHTGESEVTVGHVFVVPDVLRIHIRDEALADAPTNTDAPAAAAPAPEVELVPHPEGGPPMLKFEFDPKQYDITKQR
jgi:hypothetical protein